MKWLVMMLALGACSGSRALSDEAATARFLERVAGIEAKVDGPPCDSDMECEELDGRSDDDCEPGDGDELNCAAPTSSPSDPCGRFMGED